MEMTNEKLIALFGKNAVKIEENRWRSFIHKIFLGICLVSLGIFFAIVIINTLSGHTIPKEVLVSALSCFLIFLVLSILWFFVGLDTGTFETKEKELLGVCLAGIIILDAKNEPACLTGVSFEISQNLLKEKSVIRYHRAVWSLLKEPKIRIEIIFGKHRPLRFLKKLC